LSQVLDRDAKAVARGAARCLSQVLDRGAQADACGAATLPQQEKNNSADVHRSRINITGFISPTHKQTEGRAPVWGSEFSTKAAHSRGGSALIAAG
jgi:hypothetical protein